MQFGDWLDPDAPPDRPWEAKADSTFLANAFFSRSARLTAEAAALLGDAALGSHYRLLADELADSTWARWQDHIIETQTGCAVALSFGIVPEDERQRIQDALADLVRESEGRVATGFLGTPLVLHALAGGDKYDEAYQMLLRRQHPSWLYQVEMGATTVWERWDAIRPDGSIHPGAMATPPGMDDQEGGSGHMLSFNHYAYGAVVDWIYRHLAGIAPDRARPGYRHVVFAPRPPVRGRLGSCRDQRAVRADLDRLAHRDKRRALCRHRVALRHVWNIHCPCNRDIEGHLRRGLVRSRGHPRAGTPPAIRDEPAHSQPGCELAGRSWRPGAGPNHQLRWQ